MSSASQTPHPPRLKRWEIVGAWLHIWTPPKDLEVPPVPRRKLAIWGLALAAAIAIALALIIPPLNEGKRVGAARLAKEQAAAVAAEIARLREDQQVHSSVVPAGTDPVAALERQISADAQARRHAGTITGSVVSTTCSAATTDVVQFAHSRVYKCFVQTSPDKRGEGNDVIGTGYSFVATIYTDSRKLAWCKENPRPDEQTQGHSLANVKLSPECAGKLSAVL
jgi:hypothetical protein